MISRGKRENCPRAQHGSPIRHFRNACRGQEPRIFHSLSRRQSISTEALCIHSSLNGRNKSSSEPFSRPSASHSLLPLTCLTHTVDLEIAMKLHESDVTALFLIAIFAFPTTAIPQITATPSSPLATQVTSSCSPSTLCVDAMNSCYSRYGGYAKRLVSRPPIHTSLTRQS